MREAAAAAALLLATLYACAVYIRYSADVNRRRATPRPQSSSFASFLVDKTVVTGAAKQTPRDGAAASGVAAATAEALRVRALPLVLCLYGTATGFSKEVAELVRDRLRERLAGAQRLTGKDSNDDDSGAQRPAGQDAIVAWNMRDHATGIPYLHLVPLVVVVCSTQGDGVPPADAVPFVEWLHSAPGAPRLERTAFAVAALGDRSYPHFCRCGKQLDAQLESLGARRAVPRLDVDGEDYEGIERWIAGMGATLFDEAGEGRGNKSGALIDECARVRLANETEYDEIIATSATFEPAGAPASVGHSRERPQVVRVVMRSNLCKPRNLRYGRDGESRLLRDENGRDAEKKTVCIHLSTKVTQPPLSSSADADAVREHAPLMYEPGDAIGIYAQNQSADVCDVISALQVDPHVRVPAPDTFAAATTARRHLDEAACVDEADDDSVTIHDALSFCYDLRTPKRSLWKVLYEALVTCDCHVGSQSPANGVSVDDASSDTKRQMLGVLLEGGLDPAKNVRLKDYLSHHHVADVLRMFACPLCLRKQREPLGAMALLRHLRSLTPRLYSISSSPLEQEDAQREERDRAYDGGDGTMTAESCECQITVALVQYFDAVARKHRRGVASTFLSETLKIGDCCAAFIERNNEFRLPAEPEEDEEHDTPQPLLMIGPGTGIAPFRAFVMHQLLTRSSSKFSNHLYFGCRHQHQDFLYDTLLTRLNKEGVLRLRTAFSRDQPQRKYVQHHLWEDRETIWKHVLRDPRGIVYVCGDASQMAHDVNTVLIDIILWGLNDGGVDLVLDAKTAYTREAAVAYLDVIAANDRYRRDVWV